MLKDTITARSTPEGNGAVGMIRIAGEHAFEIARIVIESRSAKIEPRKIYLGLIRDKKGFIIDEVTFVRFHAPHSYCGEDTVEIFTHGNSVLIDMIIDKILSAGARMAHPGEFTRRAFLNGKIDLSQAESVAELISARAEEEVKTAAQMLSGKFGSQVSSIRYSLEEIIAWTEASIDFPEEEDATSVKRHQLSEKLQSIISKIRKLSMSYKQGKLIRNGFHITIAGRTNAGKSSIMNAVFDEEKSIVTPIHGTTRDIVEGTLIIEGIKVIFRDTAGFRKPKGIVEKEGIRRAKKSIVSSDMIIYVVDASQKISEFEKKFLDKLNRKKVLIVINKTDLVADAGESIGSALDKPYCLVSAKTHWGITGLLDKISGIIRSSIRRKEGCEFTVNLRQHRCLKNGLVSLKEAADAISKGVSEEFFVEHLKDAANQLGEITGEISSDDILNRIFSSFCIGK